jgi:CBS domain-containing protein
MQARDVMTTAVVTIGPEMPVRQLAKLLLERRISAVPVVEEDGRLLGIVSEGDLIHQLGSERGGKRSWLRDLVASSNLRAHDYLRGHGRVAREVMTADVATVAETTTVAEIVDLLERRRIKRVPVVRDGALVGVVSRSDLLRALLVDAAPAPEGLSDATIHDRVIARFKQSGLDPRPYVNVAVSEGKVELSGLVRSGHEGAALALMAEEVAGRGRVETRLRINPVRQEG